MPAVPGYDAPMHGRRLSASVSVAPFFDRHAPSIRLLSIGLAVIGYVLCATVLIEHGTTPNGGGGGDTYAYWTAGGNLLAGRPVTATAWAATRPSSTRLRSRRYSRCWRRFRSRWHCGSGEGYCWHA